LNPSSAPGQTWEKFLKFLKLCLGEKENEEN